MADDFAPVAEIVVERNTHVGFDRRWKWMVFVNPPDIRDRRRSLNWTWATLHRLCGHAEAGTQEGDEARAQVRSDYDPLAAD